MTVSLSTPSQIDAALAAAYHELYRLQDRQDTLTESLKHMAGGQFVYRGRRRVCTMSAEDAEQIVRDVVTGMSGESDYTRDGLPGPSYNLGALRSTLAAYDETGEQIDAVQQRIFQLDSLYTGWSRFFLVVSSAGHVHSSMSCSTCRPTTRYGWLPELSGASEQQAVSKLGPALCTVCFASAPVDSTNAKITKAQAAKLAA
jgi:hypothetical protein